MPQAFDKTNLIPVWLEFDKDTPAESRPTFLAIPQTMRGQRKISNMVDRWFDVTAFESVDQLYDEALDLLMEILGGWKNFGKPFCREALEDSIQYLEARELIRAVQNAVHLTPEEKKSSES